MSTILMDKKEETIMKLVHYFITEENYNPIVVNGVKDEIWLENSEGPYRIVRINSNNIFNEEQLNYDYFKINSIVKQIKKKTFSFRVNTLNILLNVNEDLKVEGTKNIQPAIIANNNGTLNVTDPNILEAFPNINEKLLADRSGVDLIINVTKDINEKTEKENRKFEKTFRPKKIVFTNLIIVICLAMFGITVLMDGFQALIDVNALTALKLGANFGPLLKVGEVWRLITYMFLHAGLIHLLINMYSLFILGTQTETFIGRWKFLVIFFVSGICGGLMSAAISLNTPNPVVSVGASGAIFGLTGALLYFGYYYRNYLGAALRNQIIPVILINLMIGFMISGIDNYCHIGGLVGGFLTTMALGVSDKSKARDMINGTICLLAFIGFFVYLIYFR